MSSCVFVCLAPLCECLHQFLCVTVYLLCIYVCLPMVLKRSSPPPPSVHSSLAARTWQDLGSLVGPGLGLVGGCGRERRPGRRAPRAHIPARSKKARAAPALTPVTSASVACLPTHEGLPEMLPPCLANPKP